MNVISFQGPAAPALARLLIIVGGWDEDNDIPNEQINECKKIGEELNRLGGLGLMQTAYYAAKQVSDSAYMLQAYWDHIGDWLW